ncbi:glycosyltransferase [Lithospermum erythrorhizon]|uniref:Glycosyltransferase n=1 Tax=Lithospermum erythrorhizon TaxID=34254 RepID=A0AAV3PSR8_LITER
MSQLCLTALFIPSFPQKQETEHSSSYHKNTSFNQTKLQRFNIFFSFSIFQTSSWCKDVEDEQQQHPFGLLCENSYYNKRTRPKLLYFCLLSLISCCFIILAPQFLTSPSSFSLLYSFGAEDGSLGGSGTDDNVSKCAFVSNGTICCDRSALRTDVCIMKGDVRTDSASSSVFLYKNPVRDGEEVIQSEKIRPYTRKWETSIMNTIDELNLVVKKSSLGNRRECDVQHDVPAVFFSTGGYTGNIYHEFNDGLIPLYITSQHFNKKVVFVILEYHNWWLTKYTDVLSHLTEYPIIDYSKDQRVHCFPEAIVGLRIHDELTIDPTLVEGNKTISDFRNILDKGYWPRIRSLIRDEELEAQLNISRPGESPAIAMVKQKQGLRKPKLAILSRNDSRAITNEDLLVTMAEDIGFEVEVVRPHRTSELAKIYRSLNSSDVLVGVHGAAMTHFLFMKPGSFFIQIVPLGTEWAAETYYGEPAMKLGLKYIGYKILPRESSLYNEYEKNDPVLIDPRSVTKRGWEFTKKVYLDRQNVKLNLARFRKRLQRAYSYTISRKNGHFPLQSQ